METDLHPVVRGVAAGRMPANEMVELGQMVVDHFTRQPHDPWEQAETLEDVEPGLHVVRVLVRMGRYQEALDAYRGNLSVALAHNLGAKAEMQALLRPFFPDGWDHEPVELDEPALSYLLNDAALSLLNEHPEQARKLCERKMVLALARSSYSDIVSSLHILVHMAWSANRLAESIRLSSLTLEIAEARADDDNIFISKMYLVALSSECGERETTSRLLRELDGMSRPQDRAIYRPGSLERTRALELFYRGELTEGVLAEAEALARSGRNRDEISVLHRLRGQWCLARKKAALAVASFAEAVRMSREVGEVVASCEALLALARLRAGMNFDARGEAERLSKTKDGALAVAELWHLLDERDAAVEHALRAHRSAAAEGEPYVHRYYLDRTRALLTELGAILPEVPRYDPSLTPPYPWEEDVRALIERLRAELLPAQQD